MWFAWDDLKAKENYKKHKVTFEYAATVFESNYTYIGDIAEHYEQREKIIGFDSAGRILTAIYTQLDEETIRIISARKATPNERKQYGNR